MYQLHFMIILFHIYILNSIFVTFLLAVHKSPISSPYIHTSLVDQMVKNLHAVSPRFDLFVRKTLEKRMATHSSILSWRTPWTEEPGGLQPMGLQRVGHDCVANTFALHSHSWYNAFHGTHKLHRYLWKWYHLKWIKFCF